MSVKDRLRQWLDWIVEPEHTPPPGRHRLGRPPEPPRCMTDAEIDAWARARAVERGWEMPNDRLLDPDAIHEGHYPENYGEEVAG